MLTGEKLREVYDACTASPHKRWLASVVLELIDTVMQLEQANREAACDLNTLTAALANAQARILEHEAFWATATGTDLAEYWTRLHESEGYEKDAADFASIAARLIGELAAERRCLAEAQKKEAALADDLRQERAMAEHREKLFGALARGYERLRQMLIERGVFVEDARP